MSDKTRKHATVGLPVELLDRAVEQAKIAFGLPDVSRTGAVALWLLHGLDTFEEYRSCLGAGESIRYDLPAGSKIKVGA